MKLSKDSITVNMVVKVITDKYRVASGIDETTVEKIQEMIDSGDFTAEFIPASFTSNSTGTLIITENTF